MMDREGRVLIRASNVLLLVAFLLATPAHAGYSTKADGSGCATTASWAGHPFDDAQDYTIEFWMRSPDGGNVISQNYVFSNADFGQTLYYGVTGGSASNRGKIQFPVPSPNIGKTNALTGAFNDKNWHHYAATHDTSADQVEVYLDGVLQITATCSVTVSPATTVFTLYGSSSCINNARLHFGDVRFWRTERTATEIQDNRFCRLAGNETGLAGYWKMSSDGNDSQTNEATHNLTTYGEFVGDEPPIETTCGVVFPGHTPISVSQLQDRD